MANSKYEYVKAFEQQDYLLPNTWIVVRIDGRGFHKFSAKYNFEKPNDIRALNLMNEAARGVMKEIHEIVFAYGISDEFSFVLHPTCNLFQRRASKLITTITSTFTSYYVYLWPKFMVDPNPSVGINAREDENAHIAASSSEPERAVPPATTATASNTETGAGAQLYPPLPSFDGRAVCYPSMGNMRDYLAWRQADAHINNLYNTTFWNLVLKGGLTTTEAEKELAGTLASHKNEILFSRFGINYNKEPEIYKKGSCLYREYQLAEPTPTNLAETKIDSEDSTDAVTSRKANIKLSKSTLSHVTDVPVQLSKSAAERERKARAKAQVVIDYTDIITDSFWEKRPWILSGTAGKLPT